MTKLVVGNWKLHPRTSGDAEKLFMRIARLARPTRGTHVVVVPSYVHLAALNALRRRHAAGRRLLLGAQDVFWESSGAFTGEVSAPMLKQAGAEYVIIGHSERREYLGETDTMVRSKLKAAIKSGLTAILCVGERERDSDGAYFRFVKKEISIAVKGLKRQRLSRLIIAYEPIWAIGTGKAATPDDALEMALFIEKTMSFLFSRRAAGAVPILYGGSVTPQNAGAFMAKGRISGFLVGGASLKPRDFVKIVKSAQYAV